MKFSKIFRYRDFYGSTATIKVGSCSATLTVRAGGNTIIKAKPYKSFKGAKIALGKLSDAWREIK